MKVRDLHRSLSFYKQVFGVRVMVQKEHFVQCQTPGSHDILVFESGTPEPGAIHFGFRLKQPSDLAPLSAEVTAAGGTVDRIGEFVPGEPYLFLRDPDGYEIEVWYEQLPPGGEGFH